MTIGEDLSRFAEDEPTALTAGLLDAVQDIFYVCDRDGTVVDYNERVPEVSGYAAEEIETMKMWEFVREDDRARITERVTEIVEDGERIRTEGHFLTADGDSIPYEFSGSPLRGQGGDIVGFAGTGRDIAERKQRRRELERKTQAIDAAPVGITISDPTQNDNPLIDANSSYVQMTGYDESAVLGRNCRFLQGEDTDAVPVRKMREAIAEAEPVTVELRNYREDGEQFWNRVSIAPVTDEDGTVTNFVGFQQDVTVRKERETELERQNDLFEKAQDIADVGAWEYDPHSGETYFTDQVYEIYGVGRDHEPEPESDIQQFYHPADHDTVRDAVAGALEDGEPYDIEVRITAADGTEKWVRTRADPQFEDGACQRVRGTIQDVTDRKEREQELTRQRDTLELLDRMVRHDLRNNLQVVSGHAEALADHVDEAGRESVEKILHNVETAVGLTRSARDLAEVMLHDSDAEGAFWLRPVLDAQIEEARATSRNASITLAGPVPDVRITGDDLLPSVFRNLLKNAVQHNDKQVAEVVVSATERDEMARIQIADNGPGVSDDRKAEIFGKGEMGLESDGTGIGLYLVKTLVDSYGGTIRIEDRADRNRSGSQSQADENDAEGAVFVVDLPLAA
ncbi:PAS domain S-box protein [Haloarcula rara]|uniref:PAS domain S-box protein n=2 Tax=Haloarcula TaxID=2237 RepID=UPI0023E88B31|nr:PAS domain S-box protein [Halomicroarcula sp. SHR3]